MSYKEIGCPPDYNPGFCYDDKGCMDCWKGWVADNPWKVREAQQILKAIKIVCEAKASEEEIG